ncbi:hypothetical protein LCGC14_1531980 [marine sediment metagenome]|uniref:Uncharacterized protein n=1 Tax=marine sediment metagenome TaxID=412755 RepID=A0A0F9LWG6_9ZZZZ
MKEEIIQSFTIPYNYFLTWPLWVKILFFIGTIIFAIWFYLNARVDVR